MKKVGEKKFIITVEEYERDPHEIEFENNMARYGIRPTGIIPGTIPPDDDDDGEDFIDDDWDDEDFEDDDEDEEEFIDVSDDVERIHDFYAGRYHNIPLIEGKMMDDHVYDIIAKKRRR